MFFQEATPDTSGYMIAGYAVAFLLMALYVVSIYLRNRNLKQDMAILEEMEQPAQASSRPSGNARQNSATLGGSQSVQAGTKNTRKYY